MNNVSLIGNLTRDPELRASGETSVCRFTIAINSGYGDKKRTDYIPVVAFGKTAETCERYLEKGSKVGVTGRIQTGSYEKDGRKVYTTDIIAAHIEFLSSKNSSEDKMVDEDNKTRQNERETPSDGFEQETISGFSQIPDSEIPF